MEPQGPTIVEGIGADREPRSSACEGLDTLAEMMDLNVPDTSRHASEVAELVPRVGELLGVTGDALAELELAARFHDVGKMAVPESVLRKPGPLDEQEWEVMACHAKWGAELLQRMPGCDSIARIVRHHHERYDGGGYPDGLKGEDIPMASRIISACDAYGAMVSDRPYRRALDQSRVLEELEAGAGLQFDPEAVSAVISVTRGTADLARG